MCKSDEIDFNPVGVNKKLSKDIVALVVIFFDLGIGYCFFFAMVLLSMF